MATWHGSRQLSTGHGTGLGTGHGNSAQKHGVKVLPLGLTIMRTGVQYLRTRTRDVDVRAFAAYHYTDTGLAQAQAQKEGQKYRDPPHLKRGPSEISSKNYERPNNPASLI